MISLFSVGCASNVNKEALNENSDPLLMFLNSSMNEKSIAEQRVLTHYNHWKGTPYRYGGTTKKGIDCSSLVQSYFKDYHQVQVPRMTTALIKTGIAVRDLQPGDLIFFKTGRGTSGIHVGIYYKDRQFLHSGSSKGVSLASLDNPYWKKRYSQARRILNEG